MTSIKIYLGPSMNRNGLSIAKGTIFSGPASPEIEKLKEENPKFAALFVDPSLVGKEQKGIQARDSYLSSCYNAVYDAYVAQKKESK